MSDSGNGIVFEQGKPLLHSMNGESPKIEYKVLKVPTRVEEEAPYAGRVVHHPMSLKQLSATMVREGSKYSEPEIHSILTHFFETIRNCLREGKTVNVGGLLRLSPSIRGRFESEDDVFDTKRHKLRVKSVLGYDFLHLFDDFTEVELKKIEGELLPKISYVTVTKMIPSGWNFFVRGNHFVTPTEEGDSYWFLEIGSEKKRLQLTSSNSNRAVILQTEEDIPAGSEVKLGYYYMRNSTHGTFIYCNKLISLT